MVHSIWLARHGNRQDFVDPDWHATAERPHDPGLSPDGVDQARRLAVRVAAIGVARIIASPFLRAVQTAHHVAEALDQGVYLEPGLGEWLNPNWFDAPPETLPMDALASRYGRLDDGHEACVQPSFPEAKGEAFDRIGRTVRCLADRYAGETLLLVGHGITVQGALVGFVGDVDDPGCPLASLTRVVREDGRWRIDCRNDTQHLDGGAQAADRMV